MSRITTLEQFEQEYTAGLGVPMQPKPWREVTPEWLRRHGEGSGDYNPLFRDAAYAEDARYHSLVGAPSFLFSIDFGANASIWGHIPHDDVAMKDLSILYLGADIQWFRPVWVRDRVRTIETPVALVHKPMPQLGDAVVCSGRTDYYNHRGELFASMTNHMLRFANPGAGVSSAPADSGGIAPVAPDPLVWERTRRGGEILHVEDVTEGQALPELPKGTFTTTELYLFSHGTLTLSRSRKVDDGTIDMGAGGRADPEYARRNRAQSASFDYGPQRITWLTQIITDWMGDAGDLVSMSAKLRRPNLVGDTNVVVGTVEHVHGSGEEGLVDVSVKVVNQAGVTTATATATVRLPRRGQDPNPYPALLFAPDVEQPTSVY